MRYLTVTMCLLTVAACGRSSPTSPSPVDTQFTLAPGFTQAIAGTDAKLIFISVPSDSRCPANALCITGGDAVVRFDVTNEGRSSTHELHTGDMRPVKARDLTINLVEVAPYPFSTTPIPPGTYRVTFRVTR